MGLTVEQESALKKLSEAFERREIKDWGLFGESAAVNYLVAREAAKIEVGLGKKDARTAFQAVSQEFGFSDAKWNARKNGKAYSSTGKIGGVEFELLSEQYIAFGKETAYWNFDLELLRKRTALDVLGVKVPVFSLEDLVLFKALAQEKRDGAERDLLDVKEFFILQKIDHEYLEARVVYEPDSVKKRVKDFLARARSA